MIAAACERGLASGIKEALELTPVQILLCLSASNDLQGVTPKMGGPEDFLAMLGAGGPHVEIVRV